MKITSLFRRAWLSLCLAMLLSTLANSNAIAQQLPVGYAQALPIKPTRTISFKTDEASYMDVDISPDGKTLAVDILGDLYTIPAKGGKATQLTRGMGINVHPLWSPDGSRIAFISDATGGFHPTVINIETKSRVNLGLAENFLGQDYNDANLNWSPDGYYIAVNSTVYGIAGGKLADKLPAENPIVLTRDGSVYGIERGNLFRYDKNNKKAPLTTFSGKDYYKIHSLALSPDRRWFAFIADTNALRALIIEDLQTHQRKLLVTSLIKTDPRYKNDHDQHFCFSPDSKSIYISYGGKIHRINVTTGDDAIVPFIANVKIDMGPLNYNTYHVDRAPVKALYTRSANASPDNKHLVFAALDKVWIMDLPDGKPRLLVNQPFSQFQPVFSPDGKSVAYASWCDTTGGQLWEVSLNGGDLKQLTKIAGLYKNPSWSPDSKHIIVIRARSAGKPETGLTFVYDDMYNGRSGFLQEVDTTNGHVVTLADSVFLPNKIAYSIDGSKVIYEPLYKFAPTGYQPKLVEKDIGTGKVQVLLNGTVQDASYGVQKVLSPNLRYLVYSEGEDLYLMPLSNLLGTSFITKRPDRLQIIRFSSGVDPYWEKGGKVLAWSYGNKFYRIDPNKIIKAAEEKLAERGTSVQEDEYTSVNIRPDETFTMDLSTPYNYAHGTLLLKNVRVITMQSSKIIERGTILVKDGRFFAIGPAGSVKKPKGTKIIDLQGKTIIPGLIDLHLHMRMPPDIHPQQSNLLLANLAYGVTTARDPSHIFDGFGYEELLRSGQMLGPRLYTVGMAVGPNRALTRMDNLQDAEAVVQKRTLFEGTEVKQYLLDSRLQREWLSIACKDQKVNMTNEGAYDPILQIAMLKDGSTGIEHNPVFGDAYNDIIQLYAKSGSYLTPALQVGYGTEEAKEYFKQVYWHTLTTKLARFEVSDTTQKVAKAKGNGDETLQTILFAKSKDTIHPGFLAPARIDTRILSAGGKITMGSHGNDEGIGPHNEIWALHMGGFTNMEALRTATMSGAEALGIQHDVGSIEVGKIADLVVLNSDPLKDIHKTCDIKYVMKEGILYDGDTLDEIWPVKKKCPAWTSKKMAVQSAEVQGWKPASKK